MNRRRPGPRRSVLIVLGVLASVVGVSLVVLQPAGSQNNDKQVSICHSTASASNPYVSENPAIANNGDLSGGHLNETGPVFPAPKWGDIIPPYSYTDSDGNPQVYPGLNWTPAGQAIWQLGCETGVVPIRPILECVEVAPNGGFLAHFGYDNPNSVTVNDVRENVFEPLTANGQQPSSFAPGTHSDAFRVGSTGPELTWHLTGNEVTASTASLHCEGSITVVKVLNPAGDKGSFNLEIDGTTAGGAAAVGDGGNTGVIAVDSGSHTVGESAAGSTDLSRYTTQTSCLSGGAVVASGAGRTVSVPVKLRQAVVCTITNTNKAVTLDVAPVLECVVFRGGEPDVAVWGYSNPSALPVTIPVGSANGFNPDPVNRGQPREFGPGRWVGTFETPFAGSPTLAWTVGSKTVTASAASQRCTATLELRKVTVPSNDPGVFNLLVNGVTAVTGPNGTTTGPLVVGVGDGTVSETAAAGTNLSDYSSKIDCTRNGASALSVAGTSADGEIATGDVVVCTFTNTRTGPLPTPLPPQPPIPPPPSTPSNPQPAPTPPNPSPPAAPLVDLSVRKTATPSTAVLGKTITFRITVTNASPVDAVDVNVTRVSERSYKLKVLSLSPSQGSCTVSECDLGPIAAGTSATITVETQAVAVGRVLNVVTVSSEEQEADYTNNTASALVLITDPVSEAKKVGIKAAAATLVCNTLTVSPASLQKGATSTVLASAKGRFGRPLPGMPVIAQGGGVRLRAITDHRGIAHLELTPRQIGLVQFLRARNSGSASSGCRSLLGVLAARSPSLTG